MDIKAQKVLSKAIVTKRRELDVCFAHMTLSGVETPDNERQALSLYLTDRAMSSHVWERISR